MNMYGNARSSRAQLSPIADSSFLWRYARSAANWNVAMHDNSDNPEQLRDMWFDPERVPATDRARTLVVEATALLSAFREPDRKRISKKRDAARMTEQVTAILCNVAHHYLMGAPGNGIVVSRSKQSTIPRRYRASIDTESFIKVLDWLADPRLGLIGQTTGRPRDYMRAPRRSTIKAAPRLIGLLKGGRLTLADFTIVPKLEVLVLRDADPANDGEQRDIEYTDTERTQNLRAEVEHINQLLAQADITFDVSDAARAAGRHGMMDHLLLLQGSSCVDLSNRRMRRIFSNGSWQLGGRLYGGFWQQLPRPIRLAGVRIDGERVVALDFSAMNAVLAYAEVKAQPPDGDLYTLQGFEDHRDGVKKLFNAMLFNTKVPIRFPKGTKQLFSHRTKAAHVTDAILRAHAPLSSIFGTGVGLSLMYRESEVLMAVLRSLGDQGVTALPVHDAIVVKRAEVDRGEAAMVHQFAQRTGLHAVVKREVEPEDGELHELKTVTSPVGSSLT